jgi:hypothetical protein
VLATHWKQLEQNMTALGCKSLPALLEGELSLQRGKSGSCSEASSRVDGDVMKKRKKH